MKKLKTHRVNFVSGAYWYQPSIWTFSRRLWAARPFKNIEDLIIHCDLHHYPGGIIDLNKDPLFKTFNSVQKALKTGISVNTSTLLSNGNRLEFNILDSIVVVLDDLSLEYIKKGLIFCIPTYTFKEELKDYNLEEGEKLEFIYRKKEFEIKKVKKDETNNESS
ncbi:MPN499 family protein [Mycoplasma tauri]|uniref:Uncharacterized protein n=1 Tax=Mycoplasma tauri TaxID=547987 RepID=A0A953NCN8_9MOLU|nr:hypothetical protein [Mycoplasma tauri]MBZ4195426.1 hypothetical protein [Mycoplasma tauri]MBZ4203576.1 hypothetical protein [Mycoplasma tauri]MBZ4204405.1 hypothetical protein [Mycoplasma tauri]MBZ4212677.1 hypothetical protein [Mycoplasma tauri]MBZ4218055.1 hypothetical protein [Mycoplasma tauri]